MNRRLGRLGVALLICYTALFVRLNIVQVWGAERLNSDPENVRVIEKTFDRRRGTISTSDGAVLARSIDSPGSRFERLREYPEGPLFAQITGHLSLQFGAVGLEASMNDYLAGERVSQQYREFSDVFIDRDATASVVTTLRHDVQTAARDALGEREGSVVVLDSSTGAILGLWSWPTYDPNLLAGHDLSAVAADWKRLNEDATKPLLAKTYRERFFPGSTFKMVTAAVALKEDRMTLDDPSLGQTDRYLAAGTSRPIRNFGGSTCGGPLRELIRVSCNTGFSELAAELIGPSDMTAGAESFGFNDRPPIDLPSPVASTFPTDFGAKLSGDGGPGSIYEDTARLAQVAIGQNDVSATPLQMALVAASVANGGEMMKPHVVSQAVDADGTEILEESSSVWRRPITTQVADDLYAAMVDVVEDGTATRLAIDDVVVGAKTGTAQVGASANGEPSGNHAWVIAFAEVPETDTHLAVAVIVEADPAEEQTGGRTAAPVAREVLLTALEAPKAVTGG